MGEMVLLISILLDADESCEEKNPEKIKFNSCLSLAI